MLFEELLTHISKSGPGYRWTIATLIALVSMKNSMNMFVLNLVTAELPYHCALAMLDNETARLSDLLANRTVTGNFSALDYTCTMPRFQTDADGSISIANATEGAGHFLACHSWTFLPDPPSRWTMFNEYEMVCERKFLADRLQTVLQIGVTVATLLGPLGDTVGRKPMFLLVCYVDLVCHVILIFVKDLTLQMVLIFFIGFGTQSLLFGLILLTELVGEQYRAMHGNLVWLPYVAGYMGSAAISYYILNWRVQMAVLAIMFAVPYVSYMPVLPESPRWLLISGKTERAERTLKEMCKFSGCEDVLSNFNVATNEVVGAAHQESDSSNCILKLLPRENICQRVYIVTLATITFSLFTVPLVYFALSFQRNFVSDDPYLNVLISGLIELPAYLLAWQLTARFGRKCTTIATVGFCGVALIVLPFIPRNPRAVFQPSSAFAIAIKFFVAITYSALLVYGTEVLPTSVRNCSLFFASFLQDGGLIIAPELGGVLSSLYEHLPYLLYGGVSLLTGLSVLLLPETKDKPIPNTVAEMELGNFRCCASRSTNLAPVEPGSEYDSGDDAASRPLLA